MVAFLIAALVMSTVALALIVLRQRTYTRWLLDRWRETEMREQEAKAELYRLRKLDNP